MEEKRKIVIVGAAGVGKTSIISVGCTGNYFDEINPTVGVSFFKKEVIVNNSKVSLQIYDTAGQEKYQNSVNVQYYRDSQVAFVCFDHNDKDSLNVEYYASKIHNIQEDCVFFLVATKMDLPENTDEAVDAFINEKCQDSLYFHKSLTFKTSAKEKIGIKDLFDMAASIKLDQQQMLDNIDINEANEKGSTNKRECC